MLPSIPILFCLYHGWRLNYPSNHTLMTKKHLHFRTHTIYTLLDNSQYINRPTNDIYKYTYTDHDNHTDTANKTRKYL